MRHNTLGRGRRILAAALVCGAVLSGVSLTSPGGAIPSSTTAAYAAPHGAGIQANILWLGQWIASDGKPAYCIEFATGNPGDVQLLRSGESSLPEYVTEDSTTVPALRDEQVLKHMNYVLATWGDTTDNIQAATVQVAIWKLRIDGVNAPEGYLYKGENILKRRLADAGLAYIEGRADQMIEQAKTYVAAEPQPVDSGGELRFAANADPYGGTLSFPANAQTVTITGAEFTEAPAGATLSQNRSTLTWSGSMGAPSSGKITWRAIPKNDSSWNRYIRVSASGKYQTRETVAVPKTVNYYSDSVQNIIPVPKQKPGSKIVTKPMTGVFYDIDTLWQPQLATETDPKAITKGERFRDTVTFDVAQESSPWRYRVNEAGEKEFVPITATGTLYGPFLQDPALNPSQEPPVGAPVATTVTVTTDPKKGPGSYVVTPEYRAEETGYYTWVWNIAFDEQAEEVREPAAQPGVTAASSLPGDYFYTDGFGTASEGTVTRMKLDIETHTSTDKVRIGDAFTDRVDLSLSSTGGWLQGADGKRIPVVLRGTVYESETQPIQQKHAPSGATVLGEFETLTTTRPDESLESSQFEIPLTSRGWVTVQWCVREEDQPEPYRGYVEEGCDDYGVPSETVKVLRPEVSTQALKHGAVKGDIHDVAEVRGALPDPDRYKTEIEFELFLKPEVGQQKYDATWQPVLNDQGEPELWSAAEVQDPQTVCDAQSVAKTDRQTIRDTGSITSPSVRAETPGTTYWVERLIVTDTQQPDTDPVLIHEGECGLPNETTVVEYPSVKTKATQSVFVGQEAFDTAIVNGVLSQRPEITYEVTFEAFHVDTAASPEDLGQTCVAEHRVFSSSRATRVTGVGEYESERFVADKPGKIYWVESLWMKDGDNEKELIHKGECGAVDEITTVRPKPAPALAVTAGAATGLAGLAGLAMLLGSVLMLKAQRRQRDLHSVTLGTGV